jgi:septation ring formation regulator EzrA
MSAIEEELEAARQALQAVVSTAAHPETAFRSVMVDLKPVRAAIKRIEAFQTKNNENRPKQDR